jgi:hypothetical protein
MEGRDMAEAGIAGLGCRLHAYIPHIHITPVDFSTLTLVSPASTSTAAAAATTSTTASDSTATATRSTTA